MSDIVDVKGFGEWMRTNTRLSESSILLYARTINHFYEEFTELKIENVNEFISKSFREKNSFYVKYSFKYFLEFIGKPGMYKKTTPVKIRPRKKMGKYVPDHLIHKIISQIRNDLYQDIAMIQYATGKRAREIITLKEEHIDFEFKPKVMRVRFIGKGGYETVSFLSSKFKPVIQKYLKGRAGYIFMPARVEDADPTEFERMISTMRTYYYNQLRKAAEDLGLEGFATHDFRRNVAESAKKISGGDVRKVQKILGHKDIRVTLKYFDENPADVEDIIVSHQEAEQ